MSSIKSLNIGVVSDEFLSLSRFSNGHSAGGNQAWLLALVVLPARSHMAIRISMVAFLAVATMCTLPRRIWQVHLYANLKWTLWS